MALIEADNNFAVMAVLVTIAAASMRLERTRIGSHLTATVVAIVISIILANIGVMPKSSPTYDFVYTYLVPILVPLFLFSADLKKILFGAKRMTLAFFLAGSGTVAGVTTALLFMDFSDHGIASGLEIQTREPAIAGMFAATYIGGSVNFAALGEVTGLVKDAAFFSAAIAADNLFGAVYLLLIALLPTWHWAVNKFIPHENAKLDLTLEEATITPTTVTFSFAGALLIVAISDSFIDFYHLDEWRYVVITTFTLALATACPGLVKSFSGSFELGIVLSIVFFAAIAAGADLPVMLKVAPALTILVMVTLLIHALIVFVIGSRMGFSLPELITASNAAILGATTAPALAAAKGWRDLVTPGILVGVFGYAVGTYIGTLIFKYWHYIL